MDSSRISGWAGRSGQEAIPEERPKKNSLAPVLRGEGWVEGPNGTCRSYSDGFRPYRSTWDIPAAGDSCFLVSKLLSCPLPDSQGAPHVTVRTGLRMDK